MTICYSCVRNVFFQLNYFAAFPEAGTYNTVFEEGTYNNVSEGEIIIMFLRRELIIIRSEDGTYNNVSEEGLIIMFLKRELI